MQLTVRTPHQPWPPGCLKDDKETNTVLGWTILFGLMTIPGAAAALTGYPAESLKTSSLLFALLFLFALLTQAGRSRVR